MKVLFQTAYLIIVHMMKIKNFTYKVDKIFIFVILLIDWLNIWNNVSTLTYISSALYFILLYKLLLFLRNILIYCFLSVMYQFQHFILEIYVPEFWSWTNLLRLMLRLLMYMFFIQPTYPSYKYYKINNQNKWIT